MAVIPFSVGILGMRRFGRLLDRLRTEDIAIRCLPELLHPVEVAAHRRATGRPGWRGCAS